MAAFSDYLKKNARSAYAGAGGAAFAALDAKNILDADNKLTALLKTIKDFILIRVAFAGVFTAVGTAIRGLVRDSGSLDQALKKLGQMQTFSRQLAPFVGGLVNARKRVAELAELSNRGPFRFEQLIEANRSLQIFTRGAFSSLEATQAIGRVAIGTGNDITDVSRAVGLFYDELHNGRPVNDATDAMRQMGVISEATARHLNKMAEGQQDVNAVLGELKSALDLASQDISGYKDELASVTEEHDKAIRALQEKFAEPFTQDEIQNTRNMTAAMQAVTPTVGKIAQSLAVVYDGFNTAKTGIIRFVAESKSANVVLRGLVYLLEAATIAAVAFGVAAAAQLTPAILRMGASFAAMGGYATAATIAVRGLAVLTVWGLVATAVVGVAGAFYNMSQQSKKARQDFEDWSKSHRQATSAILQHIAAISSLADKNAALAESIDEIIKSEKELADIRAKQKTREERAKIIEENVGERPEQTQQDKILDEKGRQLEQKLRDLRTGVQQAVATTPANQALIQAEAERRASFEEQNKGVEERERQARAGLQSRTAVEQRNAQVNEQIMEKQKRIDADREEFSKKRAGMSAQEIGIEEEKFRKREIEVTKLMQQRQQSELQAPEFSSVNLEAKAEQFRQAEKVGILEKRLKETTEPEERRRVQTEVERARALAGGVKFTPEGKAEAEVQVQLAQKREAEAGQLREQVRQQKVQRFELGTEIEAHEARRRGDIRGAEALEDVQRFTRNFEELLGAGFGKKEAGELARKKTEDEIQQEFAGAQQVVSSMQAIGGGGNVSGVDPMLQSARRREELQQKMVQLLETLAGQQDSSYLGQPTFQ